MKPKTITAGKFFLGLFVIGATLALVSWDFKQQPTNRHVGAFTDTIPQKGDRNRDRKVRDLDEAISDLDHVNIDIQLEKAMKEVANAMKEINSDKLKLEIETAMKSVDMDKVRNEVERAMKDIDTDKMKADMERAMKEVDFSKIKMDIDKSMASIDWDKMKANIDEVKKINLDKLDIDTKKIQEQLQDLGPEIRKSLENAKVEIEKAKVELKEYKTFVDGLEKDGLLNKKENYSIRHKAGKLYVNDKEVSADTYQKYKKFLDKHDDFNIKKDADDFNIDLD